jgi:ABC-type dipeptide/oligopeptide/nickel transport system permease subunit
MASLRDVIDVVWKAPPDDVIPCVTQANSFREVVSLQAMFVTLTVALLAYVNSAPVFQVRVDVLFTVLALLPMLGLWNIVRGHVKTESGDVYVCTKAVRAYGRQSIILDVLIVVALSWLYWQGQLPGQ